MNFREVNDYDEDEQRKILKDGTWGVAYRNVLPLGISG